MKAIEFNAPRRNSSVDAFRLLAAFFVIVLHLSYPDVPRDIAVGMRLMSRWAIPFFFIISGYFLAQKYAKTGKINILPTVERLIWMFILWALIYAPIVVYRHDLTTLLKIITLPAFAFFGLFSHMWFLPSLLLGYLFLSFCHHYNIKPLLPVVSVISLGMALISGAYNPAVHIGFALDYDAARTWLSIPFLYLGMLLFQKGKPNGLVSIFLIALGAALQIFEAKYLYLQYEASAYDHQFLAGTIPFALGMASLALNDLKFLQHPLLSRWGSDFSLGIYLIHPAVIFSLADWLPRPPSALSETAAWQMAYPLLILLLSLGVLMLLKRFLPLLFNILFGTHLETSSKH